MEQIVNKIKAYKAQLESRDVVANKESVSRQEFTFLLGGIASFRKIPGIAKHMGFSELYHCKNIFDKMKVKKHLKSLFEVKDKNSLLDACYIRYCSSEEYEQFMTFWKEAPLFDIAELEPQGLKAFEGCKNLASNFYPVVGWKGFYAWDIGERICLCRVAVACDIISEEEFWEITDNWVKLAQVFYSSYEEYAVSCLCGAIYQMASMGEDELEQFLGLNIQILDILFGQDGPWSTSAWYVPKEREWAEVVERNLGCIISKKALEKNYIGYMFRDEPDPKHPDSGWQFLYGDESQEDLDNAENATIVGLDTVCNLHPDILAYVYAKVGSEYERTEDGWRPLRKA
ncbi:MAG: DUF2185 domain-containing protein [Lachnospiraceae bacterium]|nr:DUF2185 domain-containing protein [Lachnospiraceae bacterium]